jgi:ketosteroid isomerase-like protein
VNAKRFPKTTSEPNTPRNYTLTRGFGALAVTACVLLGGPQAVKAQPGAGPTAASALAADDELSKAIRENNADGITRWLDNGWAVVSGAGGVGEGPSIFPEGVRTGALTRTTFETSEPRVRVYDNVALVTAKVKTAGMFGGKPFDVLERQTDVWVWKDGGWKCVLTHETLFPAKAS